MKMYAKGRKIIPDDMKDAMAKLTEMADKELFTDKGAAPFSGLSESLKKVVDGSDKYKEYKRKEKAEILKGWGAGASKPIIKKPSEWDFDYDEEKDAEKVAEVLRGKSKKLRQGNFLRSLKNI